MYYTQASYQPTIFAKSDSTSITEPNQAYSIRELLYRFANGTLPPLAQYDVYGEEDDYTTASNEVYDLSDIPTRYQEGNRGYASVSEQPSSSPSGGDAPVPDEPSPEHPINVTPET